MTRTHALKCYPEYFMLVRYRRKNFEIRKNDRGFMIGDTIILKEWLPDRKEYTGKELSREIVDMFEMNIIADNTVALILEAK